MSDLPASVVALFAANQRSLLSLCDALEAVADSLPNSVDRQLCLHLSRTLFASVHRAQQVEEDEVFPALLGWRIAGGDLAATVERLKIEHQVDQSYAADLADMLRSYGEGRPSITADAAGFMLRGFFEALRRHVAFEQQIILPLLHLAQR